MKKIFVIIWIIGTFCSCKSNREQKLTRYNWSIEKVVDLKTAKINQTIAGHDKIWDFRQDHTYIYNTKNENQINKINGGWDLDGHKLLIFNEFDSTTVVVEKITDDEMVWLMGGKDSMRYYLNANEKKVNVPSFPDRPE